MRIIGNTTSQSNRGVIKKGVVRLNDGSIVETAAIQELSSGLCKVTPSTQVGCPVGCLFCAAGKFHRNLTADEMFAQVRMARRWFPSAKQFKTSIMGTGEPTMNQHVFTFMDMLKANSIPFSVSTAAIGRHFERMASFLERYFPSSKLQISVHFADSKKRGLYMPGTIKTSLGEVLNRTDIYSQRTGKEVTLNYAVFKGLNDGEKDISKLLRLVCGRAVIVKLSQANLREVSFPINVRFAPVSLERLTEIGRVLAAEGVQYKIARSEGREIAAGCGQLAARYKEGRLVAA